MSLASYKYQTRNLRDVVAEATPEDAAIAARYGSILDYSSARQDIIDAMVMHTLCTRVRPPVKLYKLGYYTSDMRAIRCDYLTPMTHHQALTMRSKAMRPNNWFLYEVRS